MNYRITHLSSRTFYWGLQVLSIISFFLAVALDQLIIALAVPALLATYWLLSREWYILYILILTIIPWSKEFNFSGGLSSDLPVEPILWYLSGVGIIKIIGYSDRLKLDWIDIIMVAQLMWILLTILFSTHPIYSVKYFAAKLWYVIPFYFLLHYIEWSEEKWKKILRYFVLSALVTASIIFVRHATTSWSFDSRIWAASLFYHNHIGYACVLMMAIPATYYLYQKTCNIKYLLLIGILLFFIYFCYARIAYVAIGIMLIGIVILYRRLLIIAAVAVSIILISGASFTLLGDRLWHLSPDYEQTVSQHSFEDLISASYEMKDISSMERVHRWVAGFKMIKERPLTGFGPASFYEEYKPYTSNSFKTYVSNNPERSGIHNNYLMLAVEQGIPGVFLFIALVAVALYKGASAYHEGGDQSLILLAWCWIALALSINLFNDMIETIEVGPFFYMGIFLCKNSSARHSIR